MYEGWLIFEGFISFLEMLTSCFFASGIFRKKLGQKRDIAILFFFGFCGTILLTLREVGILPIPDYIPALVIFALYAIFVCHSKWWSAVVWALINYLLIGLVTLSVSAMVSIVLNVPLEILLMRTDGRVICSVLVRIMQLLVVQILLRIMNRTQEPTLGQQRQMSSIVVSVLSILALMMLWNSGEYLTEENISYFNIFICLLIMLTNFILFFLNEILSREKSLNQELKAQNQIVSMQIRNQNEVNEMYHNMRAMKHDMNNHLHAISGYIQLGDYEKAEDYIQKIVGEVSAVEALQSGNSAIDALIGSKTVLAKKSKIRVDIEMSVPADLNISAEHLIVVLGNLYDNAIDANLKIEDVEKRYINIQILFRSDNLIICFENAAEGEDRDNKYHWATTKKANFEHGFGIKNMDRIVQLYDGYCQREQKDNVFICRIRIPNEKK